MSFADFPEEREAVRLLQRSLSRNRFAHAYLLTGSELRRLEAMARTLAKTLNCERLVLRPEAPEDADSCDRCPSCRRIDSDNHPDVQWVRPESKSRVITIEQIRALAQTIHLKPLEASYKVGIIVAADRLNAAAANAFLKTLEEPPAKSILILLSVEPARILETILSRCLRLNLAGDVTGFRSESVEWLQEFSKRATANEGSVLSKYGLLSVLLNELGKRKASITESLTVRSPLERYEDIEPKLRERWEEELAAAIEAEYRRERTDLLTALQWWLRDVWLQTLSLGDELLSFPDLNNAGQVVANRISSRDALENLRTLEQTQWLLGSNVQEALTLEVGLLKLKF